MAENRIHSEQPNARFRRYAPWMAALGFAMMGLAEWLWYAYPQDFFPGGAIALAAGAILLMSSPAIRGTPAPLPAFDAASPSGRILRALRGRLAFAVAGVTVCIFAGWYALAETISLWVSLGLWALGIWLTIYGTVPETHAVDWWRAVRRSARQEPGAWLAVTGIFLIALFLRTYRLSENPYIVSGDESAFAVQAIAIQGQWDWQINPFAYGVWHHPRLYHTLVACAIALFGQSVTAVRLVPAILGALTAPAVYLLGRQLFERRVGTAAAIFMAAYPFHVHFTRTGVIQAVDPLFATLALALFTRAMRGGNAMDAAWAGLALGLSQYGYSAGRLIPMLFVGYTTLYAVSQRRRLLGRTWVLLTTAVVACIVAFPNLYAVYEDHERPISPRLAEVSIWDTGDLDAARADGRERDYWTYQVYRSVMAYVQVLDEGGFYGAYDPLLGWFASVPFLIGLAAMLRQWRDPRSLILPAWILCAAILGGALLVDPPHYSRYVSVTPALAVAVGAGVVRIALVVTDLIARILDRWNRTPAPAFWSRVRWRTVIGLAAGLALIGQWTYITGYLPKKLVYGERTIQMNEVGDILNSFEGQYTVWYFSTLELDMHGTDILPFISPRNDGVEYDSDIAFWQSTLEPGRHAFLVAPSRSHEVLILLETYLPDGSVREYLNPRTGEPLVYVYLVELEPSDWDD